MKKIAIITNFNISEKVNAAMLVAQRLKQYGATVMTAVYNRDKIERQRYIKNKTDLVYVSQDELYAEAELLVVLGGDGSILEASRRAAMRRIPILGINLGHLGYMAELEMEELDLLSGLFDGGYTIENRSMLSLEISDDTRTRISSFALNEIAITNGSGVARVVDLELSEGGELITSYRANGLIIATPTGSTAYSMSAGGTVCDPRMNCLCVTPICPHSLATRPLIFPDEAVLDVRNTSMREKMLYITADGRITYELYRGNVARVTRSPMTTQLIRLKKYNFYSKLRAKMNRD
ncbi:MAG: NAD(+)/NADH kinase [Clostridia bacterium]|nr:NAD(+)/NADH kinase [Clostridia bacterium]